VSWQQDRARVASLSRSRTTDDPDLIAAKQSLKASRLADYVTRVVDSAPPLTDEQCASIAALLRSGGGDRAA
jgi:hypothetical protein